MVKSERAELRKILQTQSKERTKVLETMDSKGVIPQLTKEENQHSEKLQHPKCHEKQQS